MDSDDSLQLDVLTQFVTAKLSWHEVFDGLLDFLLGGISEAAYAAVLRQGPADSAPTVVNDRQRPGAPQREAPRSDLVVRALQQGITTRDVAENWAFCIPFGEPGNDTYGLYAAGGGRVDIDRSIRFAELLAQATAGRLREEELHRQVDTMVPFFSPKVIDALWAPEAGQLLDPCVQRVTVLFCDIRGFSKRAERHRHDLFELLDRCSGALDIMTRHILCNGGVVADFQGDAALGFWGWPLSDQPDPWPACRAALDIYREFDEGSAHPTQVPADFEVGLGIAHGDAIAGRIGTLDQAKIGVIGPVVNLGQRLENLTKYLRVPILVDDATAHFVRAQVPTSKARLRRLARICPYGLETPVSVSQLLPPATPDAVISDEHIAVFEEVLDDFTLGRWSDVLERLDRLPVLDRAKDLLYLVVARHRYQPPNEWDGVIRNVEHLLGFGEYARTKDERGKRQDG